MRVRFVAVTAALLLLTACEIPRPEPTSLAPARTPGENAASDEAERLFATSQLCEVTLAGQVVQITFPGAWSTNACLSFGPDDLPMASAPTQALGGAAITLGVVGGPATFHYEWISREEVTIADRPAWRVEETVPSPSNEADETLQLVYWISVGATSDGPTIVVRSAVEEAGNYALNKAVMDRMMASLTLR